MTGSDTAATGSATFREVLIHISGQVGGSRDSWDLRSGRSLAASAVLARRGAEVAAQCAGAALHGAQDLLGPASQRGDLTLARALHCSQDLLGPASARESNRFSLQR